MTSTATVLPFNTPAKLRCDGCGTLADAACDCGVPYKPIKPSAAAAKAVAAHPERSDRAIAAEIGVDHKTVAKARRSGGEKSPPAEKRIGRDGKAQKVRRNAPISTPSVERADLSMSAQQRLDAAIRAHKRKLDAENARRNAEHARRMRDLDEEVRLLVVERTAAHIVTLEKMQAEVAEEHRHLRNRINNHRPPFSPAQFGTILMCLHPDGQRTPEKLHEAFVLFNGMKLQLSGQR